MVQGTIHGASTSMWAGSVCVRVLYVCMWRAGVTVGLFDMQTSHPTKVRCTPYTRPYTYPTDLLEDHAFDKRVKFCVVMSTT
jgi:hypothetical protein